MGKVRMRKGSSGKAALRAALASLLLLALSAACTGDTVYFQSCAVPAGGWERTTALLFDIPPAAREGVYGETVSLRTDSRYPYTSLTMTVEQTALPAGIVLTDTLVCPLTDGKGFAAGRGTALLQHSFDLRSVTLCEGDSLHIVIRHCMAGEALEGLADVGVRVYMTEQQ